MRYNLGETSKSYYEEADIYQIFSFREDSQKKVFDTLLPKIKAKSLLDLGCGSGKYTDLFAPYCSRIVALDASADQLALAREATKEYQNIEFIHSKAEDMKLPTESIDVVLAAWVLGTVSDEKRRKKILKNIERTAKPGGKIFLVENDLGGEFEHIRGRVDDPLERTKEYNKWLVKNSFKEFARFTTSFEFKDFSEAKRVIGFIWGDAAKDKVRDKEIEHRVVIYCK